MVTTNPVATVKGLCPLLQAQELTLRPRNKQGRAIELDDADGSGVSSHSLWDPLGRLLASPSDANPDRY